MQVAVVTGPGAVELREEPRPLPGPADVVVEVGACGLCTMERRLFAGTKPIYPVAPGHEAAGRVIEVGEAVVEPCGCPAGWAIWSRWTCSLGAALVTRAGEAAARCASNLRVGLLSDGTISMGAGLAEAVRVSAAQTYCVGEIRGRARRYGRAPRLRGALGPVERLPLR